MPFRKLFLQIPFNVRGECATILADGTYFSFAPASSALQHMSISSALFAKKLLKPLILHSRERFYAQLPVINAVFSALSFT